MAEAATSTIQMLWWIGVPLLLSMLLCLLIPNRTSWLVPLSSTLLVFVAAVAAALLFFSGGHDVQVIAMGQWFAVPGFELPLSLHLSRLTRVMLLMVTAISFLVHLYSAGYLADDTRLRRYFATLALFTLSMAGLVVAGNLLQLFIGWELVGVSSYVLIGHYRARPAAGAAAIKAFLMNRVGDGLLLAGLLVLYARTGTLSIDTLESMSLAAADGTLISLLIFGGVVAKSAQFPLFSWLPDAMEGPTPVSALIHAATMVAAGIFLLGRTYFLFTDATLLVVAATGAITALAGGVGALLQTDIKKVLAYSTISQLGLMTMTLGAGQPDSALLHLFTHAFFKAGLFLGAGIVIHSLHQPGAHDAQDIRQMGGLRHLLPLTHIGFLLCGASLAGLPLTSGLLSKDSMLTGYHSLVFTGVGFVVSALTAWYIVRLCWYVFWNDDHARPVKAGPVPAVMALPLLLLSAASLWFIAFTLPWETNTFILNTTPASHPALLVSSAIWNTLMTVAAIFFYKRRPELAAATAWANAFGIDVLYERWVRQPLIALAALVAATDKKVIDGAIHGVTIAGVTSAFLVKAFDRYVIDGAVSGVAWAARSVGNTARSFNAGNVQRYLSWVLAALIIFLIWQLT